ncbi:MAG: acetolactate synthase 3 large subunit [Rhodospirillaceae bacterium]|nr:acetolactate synthase 3 large subunit [Rhodospirillaceae bacterium]MYB13533.1 acetolactate synthase 3 large subunit [Rhodospirillaceae bacterium]MYI49843.1 acetolactate synthase 3 large subunit [Rhodospirillaceae bacterium]
MTGSEIVLRALVDQGVDTVFGYPGGAVLPIYDALHVQNSIRHILVRQEGGAVHAAEGYARSTGKVGVVLVTSGPGATNAVTGLTDALMDSVPVVCLTGQVPTHLIGNDAFQEADTTGITRPCTKHNYLVKDIDGLARTVHEAFYVARSGRPGPVVIDLPKDILQGKGSYTPPSVNGHRSYKPKRKGDIDRIEEAAAAMAQAERPLFYCGGGVINAGPKASHLLTELVKLTGFPCTLTLMGLGALPASSKQFLGMVGMHGTYESNLAMHHCDLMINIGARFDDRVTGKLDEFAPHSKKIHVDIDPSSINKNVRADIPIVGDAAHVIEDLTKVWKARQYRADRKKLDAWWAQIDEWRGRDCLKYQSSDTLIKPQYALERLRELTKGRDDVFITTEVGQHQMWAAQFLPFEKPNHWMTSGGLGTMGYGLPAAMGVQVAHPDALVIDVAGEASVLMNIQEMSTVAQYRLPVKIFILNNEYMGMVRQWQELLHGGRYSESYMDSLPDFVKLAESFGAVGLRAEKPADVDGVIEEMIAVDKAVIADILVDKAENCFPMIPSGAAHHKMLLGPDDQADNPISEEGMVLV